MNDNTEKVQNEEAGLGKRNSKYEVSETLERIDKKYILKEVSGILNFDKGILYTIKELFLRPSSAVKEFLLKDRKKLVKPILFIIFSSLVFIVTQEILGFNTGKAPQDIGSSGIIKTFEWIEKNFGIVNIAWGFFIGFWTRLLFLKSGFNIYEIFILLFYIIGFGNLIYTFFGIFESITGLESNVITFFIVLIYSSWAIGNFFNKNKILGYFKGFVSYILGMTTSTILIILIGALIDMFGKSG